MPEPSTARPPGLSRATSVFRQKRSGPYSEGTTSGSLRHALTVKMVPVSAFSGFGPSGLNGRASRHVPVQTSFTGSIFAVAWVSL